MVDAGYPHWELCSHDGGSRHEESIVGGNGAEEGYSEWRIVLAGWGRDRRPKRKIYQGQRAGGEIMDMDGGGAQGANNLRSVTWDPAPLIRSSSYMCQLCTVASMKSCSIL